MPKNIDNVNPGDRRPYRPRLWTTVWPKIKLVLQVAIAQTISWAIRKWLG